MIEENEKKESKNKKTGWVYTRLHRNPGTVVIIIKRDLREREGPTRDQGNSS